VDSSDDGLGYSSSGPDTSVDSRDSPIEIISPESFSTPGVNPSLA
jgi:hypothetical protein